MKIFNKTKNKLNELEKYTYHFAEVINKNAEINNKNLEINIKNVEIANRNIKNIVKEVNKIKYYINDFCKNFNTLRDEFIALSFRHNQLEKSIKNKLQKNNKKIKKPLDNKNQ